MKVICTVISCLQLKVFLKQAKSIIEFRTNTLSMAREGRDDHCSTDAVFGAFADKQRRAILCFLEYPSEGMASFDTVAEHLAETFDEPLETVQIALHHNHLPYLIDTGLIEYDSQSGVIKCRNSEPITNVCESKAVDCVPRVDH